MMKLITAIQTKSRSYLKNTGGAIAIAFALMAPVVIGSAGMALDYAQAYLVQQRLSQAIDAAALAGVASSSDPAGIEARIRDFFAVNYPPERLGATFDPIVQVTGDIVTVSGRARYDTLFLPLIGVDELNVTAQTVVQREVQGIEVALVLDNTGSMSFNNNIGTLRSATCEFAEILFGTFDPEETGDCLDRFGEFTEPRNRFVRMGLVPYAATVNVGPYGLGFDDDGNAYDTPFINNPQGVSFSNNGNADVCITEQDDGSDVTDFEGPWNLYQWCRDLETGAPICDFVTNFFGQRFPRRNANFRCPQASVLPLTNDMVALKERAAEMRASGTTSGNIGMAWGYRMITPRFPFTEAVPFENEGFRKVVVMMTDGNNVNSTPYGPYGRTNQTSVSSANVLDDRFEEICRNMDEQDNLTIYTITFEAQNGGIDDDTRALYENCAANGGSHTNVETAEQLRDVFRDIARELSNLRIRS